MFEREVAGLHSDYAGLLACLDNLDRRVGRIEPQLEPPAPVAAPSGVFIIGADFDSVPAGWGFFALPANVARKSAEAGQELRRRAA
jgi:hypothetical protein